MGPKLTKDYLIISHGRVVPLNPSTVCPLGVGVEFRLSSQYVRLAFIYLKDVSNCTERTGASLVVSVGVVCSLCHLAGPEKKNSSGKYSAAVTSPYNQNAR